MVVKCKKKKKKIGLEGEGCHDQRLTPNIQLKKSVARSRCRRNPRVCKFSSVVSSTCSERSCLQKQERLRKLPTLTSCFSTDTQVYFCGLRQSCRGLRRDPQSCLCLTSPLYNFSPFDMCRPAYTLFS